MVCQGDFDKEISNLCLSMIETRQTVVLPETLCIAVQYLPMNEL